MAEEDEGGLRALLLRPTREPEPSGDEVYEYRAIVRGVALEVKHKDTPNELLRQIAERRAKDETIEFADGEIIFARSIDVIAPVVEEEGS